MSQFTRQEGHFRETLRHEDHIHNQIEACRLAFNQGDLSTITNSVEALQLLITPDMEDDEFISELESQDTKQKNRYLGLKKEYEAKRRRARGGCPDLIEVPSALPDAAFCKQKFMICLALFGRRGLMMKVENNDQI